MGDYHQESQVLSLMGYFRKHPGLVLSISYALLTFCGILYSAKFYEEFDLDILKLANVSDLLIFGLSEPMALLMFGGAVIVAISFDWISIKSFKYRKKWQSNPPSLKRSFILFSLYAPKKSEVVMLLFLGIFALYGFVFVTWFAQWQSEQIKNGSGDKIVVTGSSVGELPKQLTLLGSTTQFLITYDQTKEEALVLAIENIDTLKAFDENMNVSKQSDTN